MEWLLQCDEPAIRHLTRRDLLRDEPSDEDLAQVVAGPAVTALLSGQQEDGGFGGDPYRKWTGAHWRLVALAELEAPADDPRVAAAAELVLEGSAPTSVTGAERSTGSRSTRQHPRQRAGCLRGLGLADDPRTQRLAEAIISWQWPDGGWNCSTKARPPLVLPRVAPHRVGASRVARRPVTRTPAQPRTGLSSCSSSTACSDARARASRSTREEKI